MLEHKKEATIDHTWLGGLARTFVTCVVTLTSILLRDAMLIRSLKTILTTERFLGP